MPGYSKRDVILIQYPFSDRSNAKVRPAIIIGAPHTSQDIFVVPLTSKTDTLLAGEFVSDDWKGAGLNIASAVKRGIYTVHQSLIRKRVGAITLSDAERVDDSLRSWLGL